jgi:hypothetical protein
MTATNLAQRAYDGELTVEEVNGATKQMLETEKNSGGCTVLFWASRNCGIKVVEAIVNKGVNVNGFSAVSIIADCYFSQTNTR